LTHVAGTLPWRFAQVLRDFPENARHDAGYQLDKVQRGEQPDDFKPLPSIGKGVEEIRVLESSGAYRVIYFARRADPPKKDLETAKRRFGQLLGGRI
jgi:phage-related protein